MAKKLFPLVPLVVFFLSLSGGPTAGNLNPKNEKAGYALLDMYILTFKKMAESGAGGKETLDQALEEMMVEAKKAKSAGSIDAVFFRRYKRLLTITKLFIIEDRQGILGQLITEEVGKFMEDVKGIKFEPEKNPLSEVADTLADEIINLHLYLENVQKKEKMKRDFINRFPSEKKK